MIEYDVEEGHEITVCGDTHGRWKKDPKIYKETDIF
jgi:hypothetical protein